MKIKGRIRYQTVTTLPAGTVHSCLWNTQQKNLTTFKSKAVLPHCLFPLQPLLCFNSFPLSLLSYPSHYHPPLASDHADRSFGFFPGTELTGNLKGSMSASVCPGFSLHRTAPLLACHGTKLQLKHCRKRLRVTMWRHRAQADPGGRSPTEKHPSSTDKDIPHLSFSSSSTLQGQLCVFHLRLLQKAHTLRLCFCIWCLFVVVVVVFLLFLSFITAPKFLQGQKGNFLG